jgi:hypothetical protein
VKLNGEASFVTHTLTVGKQETEKPVVQEGGRRQRQPHAPSLEWRPRRRRRPAGRASRRCCVLVVLGRRLPLAPAGGGGGGPERVDDAAAAAEDLGGELLVRCRRRSRGRGPEQVPEVRRGLLPHGHQLQYHCGRGVQRHGCRSMLAFWIDRCFC